MYELESLANDYIDAIAEDSKSRANLAYGKMLVTAEGHEELVNDAIAVAYNERDDNK